MGSHLRKYRYGYVTGLVAVIVLGIGAASYLGTDKAHTPYSPSKTRTLLWLLAPRDLGRLPSRSTWCTLVRSSDHCYLLQETSGDALDTGSATETWDMTAVAAGTRQGAHTPIPVQDASGWVDTTTELGAWSDDGDGAMRVAATVANMGSSVDSTNVVSVTMVIINIDESQSNRYIFGAEGADGWSVTYSSPGNIRLRINGTSSSVLRSSSTSPVGHGEPHCVTAMMDGRTVNAGKLWIDGAEVALTSQDMSGLGSWRADTQPALHANTAGGARSKGAILRARVDFAAFTIDDHDALCGTIWQPPSTDSNPLTKLAPADVSWTQTGGPRCFAQSDTTAVCIPGGLAAHAYSATLGAIGWALEGDRTNRVLDAVDLSTANWTGGIDAAAVAPDGSKTAATVSVTDASTLSQVAAGYGASEALNLRVWAKCSTGTLKFATEGAAAGAWDVDCPIVAGAWTELHSAHAAVTEGAAWVADSSGDATMIITSDATGVTADLWVPTLTAGAAGLSTIPTAGAAVATGLIAFEIDNAPTNYYKGSRGKITLLADWVSGACVDVTDGSDTGRQYGDAVDWFAFDSSDATAYVCDLALSGKDEAVIRWDSTIPISPGLHAQCLLNDAEQTWDSTPSTAWTSADPTTIQLAGQGSTSCTAALQSIRIEDAP